MEIAESSGVPLSNPFKHFSHRLVEYIVETAVLPVRVRLSVGRRYVVLSRMHPTMVVGTHSPSPGLPHVFVYRVRLVVSVLSSRSAHR